MPIQTSRDTIYTINDLIFDQDAQGHYLSMSLGHCNAAVLCVSYRGPVTRNDLDLSERELGYLFKGSVIKKNDYTLHGITRQQMAGANRFRSFKVSPPAFMQVWGMREHDMEYSLYVPDDPRIQGAAVPQLYSVEIMGNQFRVNIDKVDGYHDGDLMYRVRDHLPIPIPVTMLNTTITLSPDCVPEVVTAENVEASYKRI